MKHQFYTQKSSLKATIISSASKFMYWPKVYMILLFSFAGLSLSAQKISNVGISTAAICPGSTVSVIFTVTNGNGSSNYFTSSTNYTLYLSNISGTGFNAVFTTTSSTVPSGDGGSAIITFSNLPVPVGLAIGTGYKVSVGSDIPHILVNSGTNVSAPITVGNNPTATYGKIFASTCHGGNDGSISLIASGGTAPYTYSWTGVNGFTATTPDISNLKLGDYNVVVKDQNLCSTSIKGITIKMAGALGVGILKITSPTCAGNDGSVTAFRVGGIGDGVTPIQFKLDVDKTIPYQTSGSFTGLTAGNYTVTVEDSRGCVATSSLINLPTDSRPAPVVGLLQKINPGCAGNDGSIIAYRGGGVNPVQYKLDGGVTIPYQPSNTFSGLQAGNYVITAKDSRGCIGVSQTITLIQNTPIAISPGGTYQNNVSSCGNGSDGNIIVSTIGGVAPFHFILNGTEKSSNNWGSFAFNGLATGSYNVTIMDYYGCSVSKVFNLIQSSPPVAGPVYTGNATCIGGSDGFITTGQSGGVSGYLYSKDGGTTFQSSYRFSNLMAGTYNVAVKDAKGCISATVPVTIADGTGSCTQGRIDDVNSNNTTANREGTTNDNSTLSKLALNATLSIKAYPNPFASEFTLDVRGNNTDKVSLIVTDVLGRRWYQAEGNANQQYKLGSSLRSGIFFVQVMQGNNVQTIKIVKE